MVGYNLLVSAGWNVPASQRHKLGVSTVVLISLSVVGNLCWWALSVAVLLRGKWRRFWRKRAVKRKVITVKVGDGL